MNLTCNDYENICRLPKIIIPSHYRLFLCPDLESGTFFGDVNITVEIKEITNEILINSHGLVIETARVYSNLGTPNQNLHTVENVFIQPKSQLIIIRTSGNLTPGIHSILLTFSGDLNTNTVGFYRSTTNNPGDSAKYCALTYFEPTYARYAFPCFDEPEYKARFTVSLARPSGDDYIALSNGEFEMEVVDYPKEGMTTVHFSETVPMSTYLTCFIIGIFSRLEPSKSYNNLPVSVYSRPQLVEHTAFARDLASSVIEYFTDYFQINYPLPKLDLIAIPDAKISAMENWGLVTCRENFILIEQGESTPLDYLRTVLTIAHELCHMWFGNLVTMKWWEDLWLKEGMAEFMSTVCGEQLFSSWFHEWVFLRTEMLPVLHMDSNLSSHPVVQPVHRPDEIREIFDIISYRKGACLLRMMYDLGPTEFKAGLQKFLYTHQMSTGTTADLWSSMKMGWNVEEIMGRWTTLTGYPLVRVAGSHGHYVLTQSRFLNLGTDSSDSEDESVRWDIPIKYFSNQEKEVRLIWFHKDTESISLELHHTVKWLKLNRHQVGYYRVLYPLDMWNQFSELLVRNLQELDEEDRCNLINDAFCLASAGYTEYKVPLSLIIYLKDCKENFMLVWHIVATHLKKLKNLLQATPLVDMFQEYIDVLMIPVISSINWKVTDDVPYLERMLRVELIQTACLLGYESVLEKVRGMCRNWIELRKCKPPPSMTDLVYKFGLCGDKSEEVWELVWDKYIQEKNPSEINNLLSLLASTHSPQLLERLLQASKDPNIVRTQDFFTIIRLIVDNPVGNSIAWNFLKNEWGALLQRFTSNDHFLGLVLADVISQFSTPEMLNEVETLFNTYPDAGASQNNRKLGIEMIKSNISWKQNNINFLNDWLKYFNSQI